MRSGTVVGNGCARQVPNGRGGTKQSNISGTAASSGYPESRIQRHIPVEAVIRSRRWGSEQGCHGIKVTNSQRVPDFRSAFKASLEDPWQLIAEAYRIRAHGARSIVVGRLRGEGVRRRSVMGAARTPSRGGPLAARLRDVMARDCTAMGVTERTVRRDLEEATAANAAVELPSTVTGMDGRKPPPGASRAPDAPRIGARVCAPEPRHPASPSPSQDHHAAPFRLNARSVLLSARQLERLHLHAKKAPDRNYDDGVAAVRQAVTILHAIAAVPGLVASGG